MPEDLGYQCIFLHKLILVKVSLLLVIFEEFKLFGWDDHAHQSLWASEVFHPDFILSEFISYLDANVM